jgi:hypothetical protein
MRFYQLWIATTLAIASSFVAQTPPKGDKWLSYEPAVVELEGKLTIAVKYGPPNYGENPQTDEKIKVPILVLSQPVNVRGDPTSDVNTESVEGVKEVQLSLKRGIAYRQLIHRRVVVKGTLFHSSTGHHYTRVLMDVQEIKGKRCGAPH